MRSIILSLFILIVAVSCKITQHYQFNLDYSGSYSLDFDVSALAEFGANSPDSIEDFFADMDLDSIVDTYKGIEGISNIKATKEENILHISYDFANLNALNQSLNTSDSDELSLGNAVEKFSVQDGVFKYDIGDFGESPSDSLAEMMSFIEYDIVMKFARNIKSASAGTVQDDNRTVTMEGNFGDVVRKEKELKLEVLFNQFEDDVKQRK